MCYGSFNKIKKGFRKVKNKIGDNGETITSMYEEIDVTDSDDDDYRPAPQYKTSGNMIQPQWR